MLDSQIIEAAKQAVIKHDKDKAVEITEQFISSGDNPIEIMNQAFIPAIAEVGDLFGRGRLFLPELVQSADVMQTVSKIINDSLPAEEVSESQSGILIATVKGDVHDIGKCIVVALLKANGFTVHDIGRDVDNETIIEKAVETDVDIIGTSALLTTTMVVQRELEKELKNAGLRDRFKTIVGGGPVTGRWAATIGADAYAEDAQDAVTKVRELLKQ